MLFIFVDHSIAWLSSYKSTTYDAALSRWYDILRSSLLPTIQPNQYDKTFFVQVYHLRYVLINMIWYSSYESNTYDTAWSIWYDILRISLLPMIQLDKYDIPFFVPVYHLRYSLINMMWHSPKRLPLSVWPHSNIYINIQYLFIQYIIPGNTYGYR